MPRLNLTALLRTASKNLESSLEHLDDAPGGYRQQFVELKMQVSIFNYDICKELVGFTRSKPTGFAAAVSLKGLVLCLFEYQQFVSKSFIPRLMALSKVRGASFDQVAAKNLRRQWRKELKAIENWSSVRNQAAGHYDGSVAKQVAQLRKLDPQDVMPVATAFLRFNFGLLVALRDAGLGPLP